MTPRFFLSIALISLTPFMLLGQKKVSLKVKQKSLVTRPFIYLATVNTMNGNNLIYWNNQPNSQLSYYNLYRDSLSEGVNSDLLTSNNHWMNIGRVFDRDLNYYNDNSSLSSNRSYSYIVSAVDGCGRESFSDTIKTICLTAKKINDDTTKLMWNKYNTRANYYRVLKGIDKNNLLVFDSVSSEKNDFLDLQHNQNYCYQIEAVVGDKLIDKTGNYVKILSNVATSVDTNKKAVYDIERITFFRDKSNNIKIVFPYYKFDNFKLFLYDVMGKLHFVEIVNSELIELKGSFVQRGVYVLCFQSNKDKVIKKIIVN